ncbi:MAG: carbon storage regulator, partial [Thermoguttaceae bacterium]|nr:carbon storage regulator [Thermoguttaceae bacterium]
MLILSAKPKQERIVVDDRVEISVLKVVGNRVYLAIHGVEGSTIDRLSVAKLKRDYESPFDELFERLKEDRDGAASVGRDDSARPSAASTLREHKERRRLDVENKLGEIASALERVAA